jgi:hypothetical protein
MDEVSKNQLVQKKDQVVPNKDGAVDADAFEKGIRIRRGLLERPRMGMQQRKEIAGWVELLDTQLTIPFWKIIDSRIRKERDSGMFFLT